MRRLFIMLFALASVIGCNNDNKVSTGNDKGGQNEDKVRKDNQDDANADEDGDRKENKNTNKGSQYVWTKTEKNKFMEDCSRESEENIAKAKLKDFCSCMLTQAQKYYPSYDQMDEKSNEDDDREIFAKCIGNYGADEE